MSANFSASRSKTLRAPASNTLRPSPATQQVPSHGGPSNIALFLTNLRLLDLDLRADWPDITAVTFSTKDAQQNQKKRVQCVEWVLYQLFAIWDPDETRDKLQPFFPPLEHLQSLNLRAALFRCLDQAKKTGLLGRDAVLRKTMLDDCKGDRLEEVLAVFSTAVLKKVVNSLGEEHHEAITRRLVMENLSYTGDRTTLSALVLAHKSSLGRSIRAKNRSKARYQDFSDLLNLKERQTTRRQEQLKLAVEESSTSALKNIEARDLHGRVEKNWTGSNEWLETFLHGDSMSQQDGLLDTSFGKVWEHVEEGAIGEIEYQERQGLLEQLDSRVRQQNHRLAKWQSFEKSLSVDTKSVSKSTSTKKTTRGIDLGFTRHEVLNLTRSSSKAARSKPAVAQHKHAELIENMRNELDNVGKPQPCSDQPSRLDGGGEMRTSILFRGPVDMEVTLDRPGNSLTSNTDADETWPANEKYAAKSGSQTPTSEKFPESEQASPSVSPPVVSNHRLDEGALRVAPSSTSRHPSTYSEMPPPSPPLRPSSPQASEILASVMNTSPSPTKPRHVLSLAERTRLSISRVSTGPSNFRFEDLDEDASDNTLTLPDISKHVSKSRTSIIGPSDAAKPSNAHEDLIARTRQSMSNLGQVQKAAQVDRRRSIKATARSKRASYLPKQLETAIEDDDDTYVLDGLDKKKMIEGEVEVDYDVVFKSRPKIKTSPERSPERSPVKAWGDIGGLGGGMGSSSPTGGE